MSCVIQPIKNTPAQETHAVRRDVADVAGGAIIHALGVPLVAIVLAVLHRLFNRLVKLLLVRFRNVLEIGREET